MNRIIPSLFLAAACALPVRAVAPSQPSLEKLATETKVDQLYDGMVGNLQQAFDAYVKRALHGEALTTADKAVVDAFRPQMLALVDQALSRQDIKTMYEHVYAETYTQEEVDSLIAFYSTPTGQAIASAQLQIPFKVSTMMQQPLAKIGMKLQLAIYTAERKIEQAHAPKPVPAAPVKKATGAPPSVIGGNNPAAPGPSPAAAGKAN